MPYGRPGAIPRLLGLALLCRWGAHEGRRNCAKCAAVSRGEVIFGVRDALTSDPGAQAVDVAAVTGMAAHSAGKTQAQPTIACVTLLLISGRPGAGKTEFCRWLRDTYNFIHVDTYTRPQILYSLVVQTAIEAQATKEYMLGLGSDVVVDWGFIPDFIGSVRLLKLVGFDAWWFDADEATARELWRRARGGSPPMAPYLAQTERIRQAWPKLSKFYRDHIVQTVEPGPTYPEFDAIAARILDSERGL